MNIKTVFLYEAFLDIFFQILGLVEFYRSVAWINNLATVCMMIFQNRILNDH